MFNIHASSGKNGMKAVMDILKDLKNPPLVLVVTALTSFDNDEFKTIYNDDIQKKANSFALVAFEVGVDGVVCSTFESFDIKKNTSNNFITLCPGIRPFETTVKDDQKRVANIQKAKKELVDFVVVGRPIYNATNPQLAVKEILDKIEIAKE
jgi:orotidine-5'-phosphate decarboxylase